jgi:hypothetical protein
MDLRDFFPSLGGARIQTVFRIMGYPEPVADLLGGICTNAAPRDVWADPVQFREARILYARPHLPQGAPTSPARANMCLYRTDRRLSGLAESAGAQYTRYADDLAFSGGEDFACPMNRFAAHVAAILHEEGFAVHHRKTRIMRQGCAAASGGHRRQPAPERSADRLRPAEGDPHQLRAPRSASQSREAHHDFRAHLEGRVGYVETIDRAKGKRLRAILQRIDWL